MLTDFNNDAGMILQHKYKQKAYLCYIDQNSLLDIRSLEDVSCTCSCSCSTLLLQLVKSFQQSCFAGCQLLLYSFLLTSQAAGRQYMSLKQPWSKTSHFGPLKTQLNTLTCQKWPLPLGQWVGSWSRCLEHWSYVPFDPSHPIWTHCSGAGCTFLREQFDPAEE